MNNLPCCVHIENPVYVQHCQINHETTQKMSIYIPFGYCLLHYLVNSLAI